MSDAPTYATERLSWSDHGRLDPPVIFEMGQQLDPAIVPRDWRAFARMHGVAAYDGVPARPVTLTLTAGDQELELSL
jgi:hypothetical protein